jgi:hypothetical protein
MDFDEAMSTASHICALPGPRVVPTTAVKPLIDRLDQLDAVAHDAAWGRSRTGT